MYSPAHLKLGLPLYLCSWGGKLLWVWASCSGQLSVEEANDKLAAQLCSLMCHEYEKTSLTELTSTKRRPWTLTSISVARSNRSNLCSYWVSLLRVRSHQNTKTQGRLADFNHLGVHPAQWRNRRSTPAEWNWSAVFPGNLTRHSQDFWEMKFHGQDSNSLFALMSKNVHPFKTKAIKTGIRLNMIHVKFIFYSFQNLKLWTKKMEMVLSEWTGWFPPNWATFEHVKLKKIKFGGFIKFELLFITFFWFLENIQEKYLTK